MPVTKLTAIGAKLSKSQTERVHIGIVLYPGALTSGAHGLKDMFDISNSQHGSETASHVPIVETSFWKAGADGNVSMVGGETSSPPERLAAVILPPAAIDPTSLTLESGLQLWLRARHQSGSILCSVCGGAFLLAQTGLANGRTVTTHWDRGQSLQRRHPEVQVDTDKLLIDEGDVITAGGMMAWIDLGLNLLDRFVGSSIMLATARYMVVDPGAREQRFYAGFKPRLDHGDVTILNLQHWLHGAESKDLTLTMLSQRAQLTPRTFLRRFQKATGFTPTQYRQRYAMAKSRELLGRPDLTLEQVARSSGYEDPKAYRAIFRKVFGLSPSEYRSRFVVNEE